MQLPEEILERILSLAVSHSAWHPSPTRLSPLLVSKTWSRISTPLFYHTIHITSPAQSRLLAATLSADPALARCVHTLIVPPPAPHPADLAPITRACTALTTLDISLAPGDPAPGDTDDAAWHACLAPLSSLRHLVLRKPNNAYLSQPRSRALIAHLTRAIPSWPSLESAHIAFKLSDDPSGTVSAFARALAAAPRLHSLLTLLPAVWNPTLLTISASVSLERIMLNPGGDVVVGTGLFLVEARRYARLSELIRAGTPIIRTRAHTMGTLSPSTSPSRDTKNGQQDPFSVSRANEL